MSFFQIPQLLLDDGQKPPSAQGCVQGCNMHRDPSSSIRAPFQGSCCSDMLPSRGRPDKQLACFLPRPSKRDLELADRRPRLAEVDSRPSLDVQFGRCCQCGPTFLPGHFRLLISHVRRGEHNFSLGPRRRYLKASAPLSYHSLVSISQLTNCGVPLLSSYLATADTSIKVYTNISRSRAAISSLHFSLPSPNLSARSR